MEKLELKHLAPYLPYRLKIITRLGEINTLTMLGNNAVELIGKYDDYPFKEIKPILRPLSDLIKGVETKENNTYISELYEILLKSQHTNLSGHGFYKRLLKDCMQFSYPVLNKLFEWHFDVFGLIEKGLAVDINTLDK